MTDLSRNDELVEAASAGDLETVKQLIEGGADPNSMDEHGMGSLLTFHPEVTRYLLEHGADPDLQRNENILPVIVGVCTEFECLRLMVEAGANVNRATEHNGETALHIVAGESDAQGVRLLLDHGANPNARTKPGMTTFGLWRDARVRGETPLHRAAAWGSPEVIQLLLDAGADLTIRDANKDTPLSWASWYRRDKSVIDQLWYEGSGIGPDFPPGESGAQYQCASMFRELDVGQSALLTDIAMCINYFRLFSPGLYCCIHATVQLDDGTRFCPGVVVQVNHGQLKQCEPDDCFNGPPNFVLDVFPEDDMLDYELRRGCFERHGVIEYVALRLTEPVEWIWNRRIDGKFSVIETADNELIMSTALPGLWIPSYALKHRDWWAIMGAIARGVSRVGHHDFMDTIWKAGRSRAGEVQRVEPDRLNTQDDSDSSSQCTTCTLPSGIVAWYKAEDNAHDVIGNNHGTAFATRYGPGNVGRAFQFDGAGFVRVPDAPSLNSAAVTVEAWVKSSGERTTAQGVYRYLVAKGIDPDAASYALYTGPTGGLFFFVYDGTHAAALSPDAGRGIWDGKWHHVAGAFDGTTVRLYVDGKQMGLGTPSALKINYNMPGGNDLFIGNYFWPGTWGFTGSIDELSIYNRALSASEILTIYSAGSAGKSNGSAPATSGGMVHP
jgi:hypothetical protein